MFTTGQKSRLKGEGKGKKRGKEGSGYSSYRLTQGGSRVLPNEVETLEVALTLRAKSHDQQATLNY